MFNHNQPSMAWSLLAETPSNLGSFTDFIGERIAVKGGSDDEADDDDLAGDDMASFGTIGLPIK